MILGGKEVSSPSRTRRWRALLLSAAAFATGSCTTLTPYPSEYGVIGCFDKFNDLAGPPDGGSNATIGDQTDAYGAALALQHGYACAANEQRLVQTVGGLLVIGAAAAALNTGITATSASDRIASIGVAGAGVAGATTFLTNQDRERAYLVGQKQAACIAALSKPYSLRSEDRERIRELRGALRALEDASACRAPALIDYARLQLGKGEAVERIAHRTNGSALAALQTLKSDVDLGLLATTRGIPEALAIGRSLTTDADSIRGAAATGPDNSEETKAKANELTSLLTNDSGSLDCPRLESAVDAAAASVAHIASLYADQLDAARPDFSSACPFAFAPGAFSVSPAVMTFQNIAGAKATKPFEVVGSAPPYTVIVAPKNKGLSVDVAPLATGRVSAVAFDQAANQGTKEYLVSIQGRIGETATIKVNIEEPPPKP